VGAFEQSLPEAEQLPRRVPAQVPDVAVYDGGGELDCQRDDAAVASFDDQVHFLFTAAGAPVRTTGC